MRLLGLYREAEYSPGRHRSNDILLLELVGRSLSLRGFDVELTTLAEAESTNVRSSAALIFSMCQGRAALDVLARWEREGSRILNRPAAALNTHRDHLHEVLCSAGVSFPPTMLIRTADPGVPFAGAMWLKRGDVHASVSADVQWIDSKEALHAGLRDFASRGIAHAVLQAHQIGDEIKFYGVRDGGLFHWFYSAGPTGARAVDVDALRRLATAAADAAGLDIFGGDVIVAPDGGLTIIDVNDWPSFAPCREQAAEAIGDHLARQVDAAWIQSLVPSANQSAV